MKMWTVEYKTMHPFRTARIPIGPNGNMYQSHHPFKIYKLITHDMHAMLQFTNVCIIDEMIDQTFIQMLIMHYFNFLID